MSAQYIRCGTQCHAGDFDAGTLIQGRLPEDGQALLARFGGQVQMVYLDPPFNTGKKFDMKVRVGEKGYKTGSPTMTAIDAPKAEMESSVRFSFSELNTAEEVDEALVCLAQVLPMLRRYRRK